MRAAILFWTAALAAQTRDIPFDARNVLRADRKTDLIAGDHRVEVKRGTVVFFIEDSGARPVEIATPNVTVHPYLTGRYRIEVKRSGESVITPYGGDVKVASPRGVEWVPVGRKMIARGSPADPKLRIVSAQSGWRWIATALSQALQNGSISAAGGSSGDDDAPRSSSSDSSKPASAPAARESRGPSGDAAPRAASSRSK